MFQRTSKYVGTRAFDAAKVANWEYSGHTSIAGPFSVVYSGKQFTSTNFFDDVRHQLVDYGIPVFVAAHTASVKNKKVGLPSWNVAAPGKTPIYYSLSTPALGDGGHAIAVVGYDSSYLSYIDTCANGWFGGGSIGCRHGQKDDAIRPNDYTSAPFGVRAHVWQIPKGDLFNLMKEWRGTGWYMKYDGGLRGHAPH